MKKENKEQVEKVEKKHRSTDKGAVFGKIMAGILVILMLAGSMITLVYTIIEG